MLLQIKDSLLESVYDIYTNKEKRHSRFNYMRNVLDAEEDDEQKKILRLFVDLESYHFKPDDVSQPFSPMIVMADGSRSAHIDDLSEIDIDFMKNIETQSLPAEISARINDILWIRKRDYTCAESAINKYLESSESAFDADNWGHCAAFMKRANVIAKQLGKNNAHIQKVCNYIDSKIILLDGTDPSFLSIVLIELQIENNYGDFALYLSFIDKIIATEMINAPASHRLDESFKCKELLLKKLNCHQEIRDHYYQLAKHIETTASQQSAGSPFREINFIERAIQLYQMHNYKDDVERLQRLIEPLQKQFAKEGMQTFSSSIDITDIIKSFEADIDKCTFREAIMLIAQATSFFEPGKIKKELKSSQPVFSRILGATKILDKNGIEEFKTLGTVFTLPYLNDCYDEGILFTLKGLLCEKSCANLRNLVAHGNIDSDMGNSATASYFLCAYLKFSSLNSPTCLSIMRKNRKSKGNTQRG